MASLPQEQQPYHYRKLYSYLQWPIRLLNLYPGPAGSPLICRLNYASLDSPQLPEFDALSYVWGPSEAQKTILTVYPLTFFSQIPRKRDRQYLHILPSLAAALLHLRHITEHRRLWVDALCINQLDDDERSQQIPMMGKIYHRARSVVIWLGEEAEESNLALSFIPQITDLSKFDQIIKDPKSTTQWYALSRLMNRPWFSRRWVVQELAFAKSARLHCGEGNVDWALFADAATLFGQKQQDIVKLFWLSPDYGHDAEIFGEVQAFGALRLIDAVNRLFRRSEDNEILEGLVNLESLVTTLNVFETKDPRDSIYAVMPLAEDTQHMISGAKTDLVQRTAAQVAYPTLSIDYILPFDEIARGFVAFCIKSSNSLDILCRPWAPVPNYYRSSDGQSTKNQTQLRLSSWACTLDDAVFETRQDGHFVRTRGDSLLGSPGRPIYQASKGFPFIAFETATVSEEDVRDDALTYGALSASLGSGMSSSLGSSKITVQRHTTATLSDSQSRPAFECWEYLSRRWENCMSLYTKLQKARINNKYEEGFYVQLNEHTTDLCEAGTTFFHAVAERERLRTHSEFKFQRWILETKAEQEGVQNLLDQAEKNLERVQSIREFLIATYVAKKLVELDVDGYLETAIAVGGVLRDAADNLEQERQEYSAAIIDVFVAVRKEQSLRGANSYLELARFPVDATPSLKAPRIEVKGIIIGIVQTLGERAMDGIIPSGWFSMANWPQRRAPIPETLYRTLIADRNADGGNPPSWYKRALEHALTNSGTGDVRLQRMITQNRSTVTGELLRRVQSVIWNRRLVITDRGASGLVPAKTAIGDVVMVLYGASVPVVLRKLVSSYWLVGECYIHGSMDGMRSGFHAGSSVNSGDELSGDAAKVYKPEIITLR